MSFQTVYSIKKSLKITFLLPGYPTIPIGGFRIIYQYANEMIERGHQVTIVHPLRVPLLEGFTEGTSKSTPNIAKQLWRKIRNFRTYLSHPSPAAWQIVNPRVKMVYHFETPSINALPKADILVATGVGTAPLVHQAPPSKGRKLYFIQGFETVMGNSLEAVMMTWHYPFRKIVISKWLEQIGSDHGVSNIRYIPNAIDHAIFRITPEANSDTPRPLSILSLWHSAAYKGVDDALKAISDVHDRHPGIQVTFFGTAPRPAALPAWTNYVRSPKQSELVQLYNTHSIFVSASKSEGFGLTPMEAMACGCCFVGTNAGGYLDYAVHEHNALLSSIEDPESLATNILRVIDSPDLLESLSRQGQTDVQHFSWEKSAAAFEQTLLDIVGFARSDN